VYSHASHSRAARCVLADRELVGTESAFAFARVAPCQIGLPQEELRPSAQAGKKNAALGAGLLNSFEAAGPIARPSYRMKSLRPMRFFEINRPATDSKCGPAGAAKNVAL